MADSYVFFYEWEPTDSYPVSLAVFSQWYDAPFTDLKHPGAVFKTAEHYMMYAKALLFDPSAAQAILDAETPAEAKKRGREVRHFDRKIWDLHADDVVERGNYLKFKQDGERKVYLFETKGKTMVEASPTDRIWGIGFTSEDAMEHVDEWGTNRMGLALTRAREQLIKEDEEEKKAESG